MIDPLVAVLVAAFLAGVLAAEVVCMLLDGQRYTAAVACFSAIVLIAFAKKWK